LAAVLSARRNGVLSSRSAAVAIFALAFFELGNVSAALFRDRTAVHGETWLPKLTEFRDIADFLRSQPGPVRVNAMEVTGAFNFGDWEGIDTLYGFGAGVTKNVFSLDWPSVQTQNVLAVDYSLSKQAPRADQQIVFRSSSGVNVLRNMNALPRSWIVHRIEPSSTLAALRARLNDASFDARNTALMLDKPPELQSCTANEQPHVFKRTANSVIIDAQLACRGMLVLADTWYPGWVAIVDGHTAPIYQVFSALRGVVLDRGEHRVEFHYRPRSAVIGAVMSAMGVIGACTLTLWMRRVSPMA
jgi:hypothetical protein